jgi:hypothetical protein
MTLISDTVEIEFWQYINKYIKVYKVEYTLFDIQFSIESAHILVKLLGVAPELAKGTKAGIYNYALLFQDDFQFKMPEVSSLAMFKYYSKIKYFTYYSGISDFEEYAFKNLYRSYIPIRGLTYKNWFLKAGDINYLIIRKYPSNW